MCITIFRRFWRILCYYRPNTKVIDERYDHSILNDIDPDVNFLHDGMKSLYFGQNTFNQNFKKCANLSLISCNVRSIPQNFKDLSMFLDSLQHKFSIIGITESWLKSHNVNDFNSTIMNMILGKTNREEELLCLSQTNSII